MADAYGRPVAFGLTPGNVADINMAVPLLERVASPRHLIADKAYDADRLRRGLAERRGTAVIPSRQADTNHPRCTAAPTAAATRSNGSSAASRTGNASPPDTTGSPETTSPALALAAVVSEWAV